MQNKTLKRYQIFSTIFVIIFGVLLHFTYKLSGENRFLAWLSAINESTWEHLKLVFFPMLITTIIGYFYLGKNIPNFLCARALGVIFAMGFIITFFYTYSGILGKNISIIDILSFFIAVILGEELAYILIINKIKCNKKIAIIILIIIAMAFIIFTYNTPQLGIFKNPILSWNLKIESCAFAFLCLIS